MQLKSLTIGNFKCFKEEKTFDLERITLLTGANSSGKSSLIYAILGAMQSESFPLNFSPNGKYVNMGDFESIVYGNEKDKDIVMGFVFGVDDKEALEYKLKTSWLLKQKLPLVNQIL